MQTTLNKIRSHHPCVSGWKKILTYLNKTEADDEPLSISTILKSNGINDALWALRAVDGYDKEIKLFAIWCARQVQHLMKDQRSINSLDVAEKYLACSAVLEEVKMAADAADAAAYAAYAAYAADAADADADAAYAAYAAAAADDAAKQQMIEKQTEKLLEICSSFEVTV